MPIQSDERPPSSAGSITRCVADLKGGDHAAAQVLWERYFDRLVRLARRRLAISRRTGADADEEDAALSAFDSFCAGLAGGRFPRLEDRDDLWGLLVVITAPRHRPRPTVAGRSSAGATCSGSTGRMVAATIPRTRRTP